MSSSYETVLLIITNLKSSTLFDILTFGFAWICALDSSCLSTILSVSPYTSTRPFKMSLEYSPSRPSTGTVTNCFFSLASSMMPLLCLSLYK